LREGNPQAALIVINDALDSMSAGNPLFNPMMDAASLIQRGAHGDVLKAKEILEKLNEKMNAGRE
jgi:hypothetical protein